MKNPSIIVITVSIVLVLSMFLFVKSCIIYNPKPKDTEMVTTKITNIKEGGSYDIVFLTHKSDRYYINRGLEQGLNLDTLNTKVLNKTVTLHLAKLMFGTTQHISQLEVEGDTLFTEFN